jgi:hypothetical protein
MMTTPKRHGVRGCRELDESPTRRGSSTVCPGASVTPGPSPNPSHGSRHLLSCYRVSNTSSSIGGAEWGRTVPSAHCSFCGTFTGPFSEIEGLFTVLICIPCLEVRLAQPDTLLGHHDPGQPWEKWGCPIEGCGRWFLGPWDLEGHSAAEHPGWTATYELLRPYPNQRQRVVYRRSEPPTS